LELNSESREVKKAGMRFMSLPIPDRQAPGAESEITATLEKLDQNLFQARASSFIAAWGLVMTDWWQAVC
jgi:hypothetical protein